MTNRIRSEAYRTIIVCVDSYYQGEMTGRFYHLGQINEEHSFHSLPQLLLSVENNLNSANCPQTFTAMRTFDPIPGTFPGECINVQQQSGLLDTFVVKILFRQHSSWQGIVTWLEGRGEQAFRSVLELILLMDGALNGNEREEAG